MNAKDYLSRLKQIDSLIRNRATGCPEQFAGKLCMSKRRLYTYINELKKIGLPITYCRDLKSYIYTTEGRFVADFIIKANEV